MAVTGRESLQARLHPGFASDIVSRDRLALRADFPKFFRDASGQARSASGHVFRLHFRLLVHQRDCTTHVLRVYRYGEGGDRECGDSSLRSRNLSVPSYRPLQTQGCTSACASEAQVRVRSSTRSPSGTFATHTGARAGVQSPAQGPGQGPLCSWAFVDARRASVRSTVARLRPG
jgi:hypothetical protein